MAVKFCPSCGTQQPEEVKFCKSCGYNFSAEESTEKPVASESKVEKSAPKDEDHIYDESEEDVSEPVKKPRKKSGIGKVIAGIIGLIALIALVIFYIIPNFFPEYALNIFEEEPEPLAVAGSYHSEEGIGIEINEMGRATTRIENPDDTDFIIEVDFDLTEVDEEALPFSFEEMLIFSEEEELLEMLNFDANPEYSLYIGDRKSDHHMEVSMANTTLSDGSVDAIPEFMEFFDYFDFEREIEDGRVTYSGNYQPYEILKKEYITDTDVFFAYSQMYLYHQGELRALRFLSYAGEALTFQ